MQRPFFFFAFQHFFFARMMLMTMSHCSAALYVVKVLRGAPPADLKKEKRTDVAEAAASEVRPSMLHSVTLPRQKRCWLRLRVFIRHSHKLYRVCIRVCAVAVHGCGGRGSCLLRLQGGPEFLHEQEEECPDHSDVHRPVQQISSQCSRWGGRLPWKQSLL